MYINSDPENITQIQRLKSCVENMKEGHIWVSFGKKPQRTDQKGRLWACFRRWEDTGTVILILIIKLTRYNSTVGWWVRGAWMLLLHLCTSARCIGLTVVTHLPPSVMSPCIHQNLDPTPPKTEVQGFLNIWSTACVFYMMCFVSNN